MPRREDTMVFASPPVALAWAAAGGKRECEGPLAADFDLRFPDNRLEQKSWEMAESELLYRCMVRALQKGQTTPDKVDAAFCGDLQAQCTASAYAMRRMDMPFAGLYGACSTMAEGVALAGSLCAGGFAGTALAGSVSHFCASERQFRTPLEYGGKRTPTAQWTATAAGVCLLGAAGHGPRLTAATLGRVRDFDIKDINNMGAAMAPAAAETILRHLHARGTLPQDYDAILTGDLGKVGTTLLHQLLAGEGVLAENHLDCGLLLYDTQMQHVHAGGSGAGCSACVLCSYVLPRLADGRWRRVLFLSTGALMSLTTFQQKESIPGIAHAIEWEGENA